MKDSRINDIKRELTPKLGKGFAEYVGNIMSRLIKRSNRIVVNWEVLPKSNPPKWFITWPYHAICEKVVRRHDNKPYWIYIIIGD